MWLTALVVTPQVIARAVRLAALLATCALTAAGCSILADYPDSRLPGADGGTTFVAWQKLPCSTPAPAPAPAATPPGIRVRYPANRTLSPITPFVADNLLRIAARHPGRLTNVFMRIGDSISVNTNFLNCLTSQPPFAATSESTWLNLADHTALRPTIDYFAACVGETTPFERTSIAAQGGTGTAYALGDTPPRIDQEDAALGGPQFAVVMYGTNDLGLNADPASQQLKFNSSDGYPHWYLTLVDALLDRGIVPILTTIPPKTTSPQIFDLVPSFNAVVRGIAEARQVPLVDWNREMLKISDLGLQGDGTHPYVDPISSCDLSAAAVLKFPYNSRNLLTLETLEELRKVFVDHAGGLEAADPAQDMALSGAGTLASPWVATALPFTDVRDLATVTTKDLTDYPGCAGAPAQPGPEAVYRLTLTRTVRLRAFVSSKLATLPLRVNLLQGSATGAACAASEATVISRTLAPGTWYFTVDATQAAVAPGGDYFFGIVECEIDDSTCN